MSPQFDELGLSPFFICPSSIQISGKNINAGRHLHIISARHKPVSLTTWSSKQLQGHITIGDFCLLSPGVNIASARNIDIGDNCMLAAEVYISDCDWHGIYNRTRPFRCSQAVHLKSNVWVGFRSIIGKGVVVGENSIIAAGSVVTENVPDNAIVGGNPARIIKTINPTRRMLTREFLFRTSTPDTDYYLTNQKELDAYLCADNSISSWLRTKFRPRKTD